jgi:hypothetical protein
MLIRPIRRTGESEVGYKLRLAHVNGLADPAWMARGTKGRHERLLVCPACLKDESDHWLDSWQAEQPYCKRHGTWLIDTCQACSRPLVGARARFLSCRCGHALTDNSARLLSPATLEVIERRHADASVLRWFGAIAKYGLQGKPGKRSESKSMAEQADLLERGADLIMGWPASFETLLDGLRTDRTQRQASLANEALPSLNKHILRIADEHWRRRVVDAARAYVQASHKTEHVLLSRHVGSSRGVGCVAKRLGVSTTKARAMLFASESVLRVTSGGRHRYLVSEAVETAMRDRLATVVSMTAAADLMSVSLPRLRELVHANIVSAQSHGVSAASIDGAMSRLGEACAGISRDGDNLQPLPHVLRILVSRASTAAFFNALFAGEILIFRANETNTKKGCDQFQVSASQVRAWMHNIKQSKGSAETLDITSAAKTLQVKPEVVTHLVAVGLLRPSGSRVGLRGRLAFSAQEIQSFDHDHVLLKALAADAGVAPKNAPRWAIAQGISLICGPSIDGCRQYIARRPGANSEPNAIKQKGAMRCCKH